MNTFIFIVFAVCAVILLIAPAQTALERWRNRPGQHIRQAQRIASQASRDFKRRQRLRFVRFWNF